ncbi:MAG: zinc-dependent alcohol dehydrogenase family protein [Pseudomonas sp.]|jgi:NADPH:quinone reductase-like Zn-dependent oxidoreductase|uniref:zinc-dependent alcohol dehydrogenase family protein n=1 Tax=Pseudomonas sp. TaxID=306 RepID=UPI00238F62D2|nr:zinc-dependent alcohol dehydrogenase family protein [Pseudomonas sp.]MDE1194388.1 zinc-dependent alcohol dehydrogenase family protein [Pseudomonas sp.]
MSTTMHAAVAVEHQQPLVLQDLPVPQPGPGQVLVRVLASAVNPLDTKIAAGKGGHANQTLPAVLGMDLAGVVERLGEGVTAFSVGAEVYGMAGGIGGNQGALAQYIAVDADLLARKPHNLSMREAAALPLIFITAWEGLVDRANVRAGQKVLIHGGAGGVGHVAVQIAKARGAEVFATGSAHSRAAIESFGATPIDYRSSTVDDYMAQHTDGEGFDVVYDTVGGSTLDASFAAVKIYTGHVLSCLGWGEHKLAPLSFRGATYSGVFTLLPLLTGKGRKHHGEILAQATRMAQAGQLRVLLDAQRFTLTEVNQAYERVSSAGNQGKVVIDIA